MKNLDTAASSTPSSPSYPARESQGRSRDSIAQHDDEIATDDGSTHARRLIVAHGLRGEIGADGDLLWRMPADMQHFRQLTMGASLIMGGRTWRSIGRVLPGREMIVVTRGSIDTPEVVAVDSLASAFTHASRQQIYVIGGGEIYDQALAGGYVDAIDATIVHAQFPRATVYYHPPEAGWREVSRDKHEADDANPYDYDFVTYVRE